MDDKKVAIIKATGRLLEEGGQITIDKVAAAAGVAKGTVYLYFNSKQDLIQQTFISGIEELYKVVDNAARESRGSSFNCIAAMVNAHYKLAVGKVVLMHRFFAEEPELMRKVKNGAAFFEVINVIKRIEGRYADELARGIDNGEFRPHKSEIIAAALLAMINNLSMGHMFRSHLDEKQIMPEVLKMVLSGIAVEKTTLCTRD
ncbi:MAG: TetR/AcrR family transcriptional regulator [Clostridiales bacterium]|nr:TetR/AcrR family transcriptional regulator [Clostridiales bacterium]